MDLIGYSCALALAFVFVWAGVAKLRMVDQTRTAFAALRVPRSASAARVVPFIELVLAVLLVAAPATGGAVSLGVVAAFTVLLVRVLRSGVPTPCNCFGSLRVRPISKADVLRNVGLMALAAGAVLFV